MPDLAVPNGRLLGFSLDGLDEESLLVERRPTLYALGHAYHREREPLILVHGLDGAPADLQPVVDRFFDSAYQLHIIAWADVERLISLNGEDFADELRRLSEWLGPERRITLLAHSLGGILCRQAINHLALDGGSQFGAISCITVDTPWHGYPGPSDQGWDALLMAVARLFMPAGLLEMRAESSMFHALYRPLLPDHFSIEMVFAESSEEVLDYTEGVIAELPARMVDYFSDDTPVRGDARLLNFWKALVGSAPWFEMRELLSELGEARQLDLYAALAALQRFYPRFLGDHLGVLRGPPFLDWLERKLR